MKNDGLTDIMGKTLSFRHEGFLGAALRARSGGPSGRDNGDSVIMDFSSGFFAVSDSSDRNPSFSRDFLRRFADMIEGLPNVGADRPLSEEECLKLLAAVEQHSTRVLHDVISSESCTLTGMLIVKTTQGLRGLIVHTGDSLLFLYEGDCVRQVSGADFWMAGRTTKLSRIEYLPLSAKSRLLFATDGLSCLNTDDSEPKENLLTRLFKDYPADSVPGALMACCNSEDDRQDDLALISLNPSGFIRKNERVVLGGAGLPGFRNH